MPSRTPTPSSSTAVAAQAKPAGGQRAETSSMALARVTPPVAAGAAAAGGSGGKQGKIPAFLQKLYTMVDSPETESLIYWSPNGDSFFVPNHEAFGKELLPRFFKHSNFSSFVRQLNMYGFHKVPHLQQGVLEPNSSSELWEFTNPNFQRGQQHLLPLVTRKKAIHPTIEHPEGEGEGSGSGGGSSKVDVPGILNSIASIRAQQTALSADLKELQQSNQHLWTEALAARERHKQHQDTTDRILRFLAGVFGQGAAGDIAAGVGGAAEGNVSGAVRAAKESMAGGMRMGAFPPAPAPGSGGVIARNRGLMIQGSGADLGGDLGTLASSSTALPNGLHRTLTNEEPLEEISADRFMEVTNTPTPSTTTASARTPDPTSTALVPRTPQLDLASYFGSQPQASQPGPSAASSSTTPASSSLSLDAFTPSFLADFASAVGPLSPATLNQLGPANTSALEKSYQSADAISSEVDGLQASIEDLVASLGLAGEMRPDGSWDPPPAEAVNDVANQYTGADFDMESFLSDLTGSGGGGGGAAAAVPPPVPPSLTSSVNKSADSDLSDSSPAVSPDAPVLNTPVDGIVLPSAPIGGLAAKRAAKRKSDVALVDGGVNGEDEHGVKSQRFV